jgi:tetratricopeptide (TPR) repeat protein
MGDSLKPPGASSEVSLGGATISETPNAPQRLLRGATLDRYIVVDFLGGGGMGEVYTAYDPELDRKIAIKLLRTDRSASASTETARTRLLREAQALARLQHPNVIAVYDVGTVGDEVFIAMELVDGATVTEWLKAEQRSLRDVIAVFTQAGRGLAAAHAAGLVHRDFKPDNVLIGRDGRVRVLDFGVARAAADLAPPKVEALEDTEISGRTALSTPLTQTGAFIGTPAYMAPEQFRGETVLAQSDQFGFCVALYKALYGERPFDGETATALLVEMMGNAVRPAPKDSRVPVWVRTVLLRGLRANAGERFPSMDKLLGALADDPAPKRRRVVTLLVSLAALMIGGVGIARFSARGHDLCRGAERKLEGVWDERVHTQIERAFTATGLSSAPRIASSVAALLDDYAHRWTAMHTEACEATRVRGEQSDGTLALRMSCLESRRQELSALTHLLSGSEQPPDPQLTQKAVEAVGGLSPLALCADVASLTSATPPPRDPQTRTRVEQLRVRVAEARTLGNAARYKEGLVLVDGLISEAEKLKYPPLYAEALVERGAMLIKTGRYKEAESALVEAYAQAYEGRAYESAFRAAVFLINDVGYWLLQFPDAMRWGRFARAALELLPGRQDLEAKLMREEAQIHVQKGEGKEAVELAQMALTHAMRAFGERDYRVSAYYTALGLALRANGDLDGAWKADEQDLAISRATLGEDHPEVAVALINLGVVAAEQHRFDVSMEYESKALGMLERTLGPDHPTVGIELSNFGETLTERNRCEEAMPLFHRSLAINEKAFGADHPDAVYPLNGLGNCLILLKRPAEALAPLERALAVLEKGEPDPDALGKLRFNLARAVYQANGSRARAVALAEKARDAFRLGKHNQEADEVAEWLRHPR